MTLPTNAFINLFHLLFVAPLLLYIGQQKSDAPAQVYSILLALSLVVLLYHSWRLSTLGMNPINLFHVAFVAPFLFYIAWNKGMVDARLFMLASALAVLVIVYHAWRLYQKVIGDAPEPSWLERLIR